MDSAALGLQVPVTQGATVRCRHAGCTRRLWEAGRVPPPWFPLWKTWLSGWDVNFHDHPEGPWVPSCHMFRMMGKCPELAFPCSCPRPAVTRKLSGEQVPLERVTHMGAADLWQIWQCVCPPCGEITHKLTSRSRGEMGHRSEKAIHRKKNYKKCHYEKLF